MFGFTDLYLVLSNTDLITTKKIEDLILDACYIKLVQETEIEIESFGYTCKRKDNEIILMPPSIEFEKSFRLGHIVLDMARQGNSITFPENHTASLLEYARKFNSETNNAILKWESESLIQRYVIAIPELVLEALLNEKGLLQAGLFKEEMLYLREVENELHISPNRLKDFKIYNQLTFYDVFIVRRILSFLCTAYFDLLEKKSDKDYHNANIPFLSIEKIELLLGKAIGKEKLKDFLQIFSYDNKTKSVFDIQYTPLLRGEKYYIIPLNVITVSHVLRNILFPLNKRIYSGNAGDPIADKLVPLLIKKGFEIKTKFNFTHNGLKSEMDVLAIKENNVFVFECKNSILPVNPFELRTVFDEIKKAAFTQLPLSIAACTDKSFIKKYDLKINANAPINVYGCIVTTNRLFSGLQLNEFPIRNIKNLGDFIEVGKIGFVGGEEDNLPYEYLMWEKSTFQTSDLISYLENNNKFYKFMFDSLIDRFITHKMDNLYLKRNYYPLNTELMADNFRKLQLQRT